MYWDYFEFGTIFCTGTILRGTILDPGLFWTREYFGRDYFGRDYNGQDYFERDYYGNQPNFAIIDTPLKGLQVLIFN